MENKDVSMNKSSTSSPSSESSSFDIVKSFKDFTDEYPYEILLAMIIIGVILYGVFNQSFNMDEIFGVNKDIKMNEKVKDIINHSLMIHLENDEISTKRLEEVQSIYNQYNLPLNIFSALHWEKNKEELLKLPLDYKNITANNKNPGAYGLAGSFYKSLLKAYSDDWPYLLFLEDDAVPNIGPEDFNKRFNEIIDTLPDNGEGIYNLGIAVYCQTNDNEEKKWIQRSHLKKYISGAHCILIHKKYIRLLIQYIQKKNIHLPIDHFIGQFNPWIWYGDLSENGMFRGLYKQIGVDCQNVHSLSGPMNNFKVKSP